MAKPKKKTEKKKVAKHRKSIPLSKLVKMAGLTGIKCESCGKTGDGLDAVKRLFDLIIEQCAQGIDVRITGFGTFHSTILKGRKLSTPIIEGGETSFEDTRVLRFHQTPLCKRKIKEG